MGKSALASIGAQLRVGIARALQIVARWRELAEQRRTLLALDDRLLADIGVSRAQALEAARQWFWEDSLDARPARNRTAGASDTPLSAPRRIN